MTFCLCFFCELLLERFECGSFELEVFFLEEERSLDFRSFLLIERVLFCLEGRSLLEILSLLL